MAWNGKKRVPKGGPHGRPPDLGRGPWATLILFHKKVEMDDGVLVPVLVLHFEIASLNLYFWSDASVLGLSPD